METGWGMWGIGFWPFLQLSAVLSASYYPPPLTLETQDSLPCNFHLCSYSIKPLTPLWGTCLFAARTGGHTHALHCPTCVSVVLIRVSYEETSDSACLVTTEHSSYWALKHLSAFTHSNPSRTQVQDCSFKWICPRQGDGETETGGSGSAKLFYISAGFQLAVNNWMNEP